LIRRPCTGLSRRRTHCPQLPHGVRGGIQRVRRLGQHEQDRAGAWRGQYRCAVQGVPGRRLLRLVSSSRQPTGAAWSTAQWGDLLVFHPRRPTTRPGHTSPRLPTETPTEGSRRPSSTKSAR
jgi:hypothetical protein